jgi:hypothetical protein
LNQERAVTAAPLGISPPHPAAHVFEFLPQSFTVPVRAGHVRALSVSDPPGLTPRVPRVLITSTVALVEAAWLALFSATTLSLGTRPPIH